MVKQAEKNTTKAYLRLIGFVLVIAFGVITFIISEPASKSFMNMVPSLQEQGVTPEQARILVGITIFVVLLLFSYFLFSLFAPKSKKEVKEKDLEKERALKQAELKEKKKRAREINRKMAESNREKNK